MKWSVVFGISFRAFLNSGFSFANLHSGNMDSYANKCVILGSGEANLNTAAFQNFAAI